MPRVQRLQLDKVDLSDQLGLQLGLSYLVNNLLEPFSLLKIANSIVIFVRCSIALLVIILLLSSVSSRIDHLACGRVSL